MFTCLSCRKFVALVSPAILASVTLPAALATSPIVHLAPGQNIQAAVNAAPPGTTFSLSAGTYRMQSVVPKDYDLFQGAGSVVLNGSQVLNFKPDPSGNGLWIAPATVLPPDAGFCQTSHPLCNDDQDLFIDGVWQTPAASPSSLAAGTWYLNRTAGIVFLTTNPTGHTVEIGMTPFAFSGTATGVVIQNLIVEEYANPAQTGAVGGYKDGNAWIARYVIARWNHGTGISLGPSGKILSSSVQYNGQMGVAIAYGSGSQVVGNDIGWNNSAGYSTNFEAGGSKFWSTTNLLVESNYVHNNNGPGLWTDFDNIGTVYESNVVVNNLGAGILHEISYNASIVDNTLVNNGNTSLGLFWNSQILLANSSWVDIESNTLSVPAGGEGIGLVNEPRGAGAYGAWLAANNSIHHNKVIYTGLAGLSGIVDYLGGGTAVGNEFDYDQYVLYAGGATHWMWFKDMTWPQLQGSLQETHGTCCR